MTQLEKVLSKNQIQHLDNIRKLRGIKSRAAALTSVLVEADEHPLERALRLAPMDDEPRTQADIDLANERIQSMRDGNVVDFKEAMAKLRKNNEL